jgi:hypothetical protein
MKSCQVAEIFFLIIFPNHHLKLYKTVTETIRQSQSGKLALFMSAPIIIAKTTVNTASLIFFHRQRAENSADDSSSEQNLKNSKTSKGFCLDLEISIFVKNILIISRGQVP